MPQSEVIWIIRIFADDKMLVSTNEKRGDELVLVGTKEPGRARKFVGAKGRQEAEALCDRLVEDGAGVEVMNLDEYLAG